MGLVDDEKAETLGQAGQHPAGEAGGVEPLRADGQQIDIAGGQ
jgi:hypothetical protein